MHNPHFDTFFVGKARVFLLRAIDLELDEDGRDLTAEGIFRPDDILHATIVAKEAGVVAGLPIAEMVLAQMGAATQCQVRLFVKDGEHVAPSPDPVKLMEIDGPAAVLLKAERVILNFCTHLSGIATLTSTYVKAMGDTRTKLLDTRKTLPGLRYPEKYAVFMGGGGNHRVNLEEKLMVKDNHADRCGSITAAVQRLRATYADCPPIVVECRTAAEVDEAVACNVERIMVDNMGEEAIRESLARIPKHIETEVSGGVNLETIGMIAKLNPDFVSVGRLTHSARAMDMSMRVTAEPRPEA